MRIPNEKANAVPLARDGKRALSDERRRVARRTGG